VVLRRATCRAHIQVVPNLTDVIILVTIGAYFTSVALYFRDAFKGRHDSVALVWAGFWAVLVAFQMATLKESYQAAGAWLFAAALAFGSYTWNRRAHGIWIAREKP
jgi:hypothetical protein